MSDMQNLRSKLIPGAPLREADYFDGPLSWWSNGLPCGGVERQIISAARYFYDKGRPITLLCLNLDAQYGNDFFLKDARSCCRDVLQFSTEHLDASLLPKARGMVVSLLRGCSPVIRDTIACSALWLLHVHPRLLQIWNADNLEALLAADPAYIFVIAQGDEAEAEESFQKVFATQPVWKDLTAVQTQHVYHLPKDYFQLKPNANWGDAYQYVLDILLETN